LYLSYLPLFIVSLALCITASYIYVRYLVPKYKSSVGVLVKSDEKSGGGSSRGSNNGGDLIDAAVFGGKKVNLDNEIELMRSKVFLKTVVEKNGFNVRCFQEGNVKKSEVYGASMPFQVLFQSVLDSNKEISFTLKDITKNGANLYKTSNQKLLDKISILWNTPFEYFGAKLVLNNVSVNSNSPNTYQIRWIPIKNTALELYYGLSISILSPKTTIIVLSLVSDNPQRGGTILNAIVNGYINKNIAEKNKASENTVDFINNRLEIVKNELDGVEEKSLLIKKANPIFYQKELLTGKSKEFDENTKLYIDILGRLDAVTQLQKRIRETNDANFVPSYLGIDDPTVAFLISTFNQNKLLLANLEKELSSNSEIIIRSRISLEVAKNDLLRRLNDYNTDLDIKRRKILENDANLKKMFGGAADFEKDSRSVLRDQNIKEAIYIYLMQRREETLVTSASTVSNYQVYDEVNVPDSPFEPDQSKWRLYGIILGLVIPIAIIYLKTLLNDKVTSR